LHLETNDGEKKYHRHTIDLNERTRRLKEKIWASRLDKSSIANFASTTQYQRPAHSFVATAVTVATVEPGSAGDAAHRQQYQLQVAPKNHQLQDQVAGNRCTDLGQACAT
jgi:hypothetical protein